MKILAFFVGQSILQLHSYTVLIMIKKHLDVDFISEVSKQRVNIQYLNFITTL